MNRSLFHYALATVAIATVPVGCMSGPVTASPSVAVTNPLPMLAVTPKAGGTVTLSLPQVVAGSFKTKGVPAKVQSNVSEYVIALVSKLTTEPGDYSAATVIGSPYHMGGANFYTAGSPPTSAASQDTNMTMQFTNVPPGDYRATVMAVEDADRDYSTPGDRQTINQSTTTLHNNPSSPLAVSSNYVTVTAGSAPAYAPSGSQLDVTVNLLDEMLDPVPAQVTVVNGAAAPPTAAIDL